MDSLNATACSCGWTLPLSVFAYPLACAVRGAVREADILPGTFVSLICPQCKESHLFFSSIDPAAIDVATGLVR